MWDATGKLPDGVLAGNTRFMGSFRGCMKVDVHESVNMTFGGKFCQIMIGGPNDTVPDPGLPARGDFLGQTNFLEMRDLLLKAGHANSNEK